MGSAELVTSKIQQANNNQLVAQNPSVPQEYSSQLLVTGVCIEQCSNAPKLASVAPGLPDLCLQRKAHFDQADLGHQRVKHGPIGMRLWVRWSARRLKCVKTPDKGEEHDMDPNNEKVRRQEFTEQVVEELKKLPPITFCGSTGRRPGTRTLDLE